MAILYSYRNGRYIDLNNINKRNILQKQSKFIRIREYNIK